MFLWFETIEKSCWQRAIDLSSVIMMHWSSVMFAIVRHELLQISINITDNSCTYCPWTLTYMSAVWTCDLGNPAGE
jgi:hypothetical protein